MKNFLCGLAMLWLALASAPGGLAQTAAPAPDVLAAEVTTAGFHYRPPQSYEAKVRPVASIPGAKVYVWYGDAHENGVRPAFSVFPVRMAEDVTGPDGMADSLLRDSMRATRKTHAAVTFTSVEHGTLNGMGLTRIYWNGKSQRSQTPVRGCITVLASRGAYLIVSGIDTEAGYTNFYPVYLAALNSVRL